MNCYGEIKKGETSITRNQVKKHRSQLSSKELDSLVFEIRRISRITLSRHLKEKDIRISMGILYKTMRSSDLKNQIIEVNKLFGNARNSRRVLIRSNYNQPVYIKGKGTMLCNLCFVIDLTSFEVVTAYYNQKEDNHQDINMNRYNDKLKMY